MDPRIKIAKLEDVLGHPAHEVRKAGQDISKLACVTISSWEV